MDTRASERLSAWLGVGIAGGILLGALAVLLPLRMGASALKRMEF